MPCSSCGADETVWRTSHCARCLLLAADADDADAAISIGADEAPPCELLSIMGDSSRATTFLGEQTWPVRRLVALKLFKDARLSPSAPSRIPRHPNIAPVLETGLLGGRHYMMTAYLAGGMLPTCYDRHRLGADARMVALVAIANALAVAHAKGVVHGRLTAANLLCEPHVPFAVQIVDFDAVSPAPSDDGAWDALIRADLAALVVVAGTLLRSPLAQVPAAVDLTTELRRVASARRAADMRSDLEGLAARLTPG